ncbi:MAG TPA: ribonuclease HII, partial [Candidatus Babeliaceae bacterium]|nr:ribonuclease HII [Candidatus Babeliaceae bacterium]
MTTIKVKPDFKKNHYETLVALNNGLLCGVDEVGRGCLAGPVVAVAAILYPGAKHRLLQDSKELTATQRQQCYDWLKDHSWYAFGIINPRTIDRINIYRATLLAMERAVIQLYAIAPVLPSMIVVDSMPLTLGFNDTPVIAFNYGESKSRTIAAASIIAKVTRDHLMEQLQKATPKYHHAQHKGYCTPSHRQELLAH